MQYLFGANHSRLTTILCLCSTQVWVVLTTYMVSGMATCERQENKAHAGLWQHGDFDYLAIDDLEISKVGNLTAKEQPSFIGAHLQLKTIRINRLRPASAPHKTNPSVPSFSWGRRFLFPNSFSVFDDPNNPIPVCLTCWRKLRVQDSLLQNFWSRSR